MLPTPYYEADGITLYCGDNRTVLPHLGRFDLLLTDPPYGIASVWKGGLGKGWRKADAQKVERNSWDNEAPSREYLESAILQCDDAIIWGGNYFQLRPSRGWLVWNKPERNFTLSEAELAWTSLDMVVRVFDYKRSEPDRQHPTQKPISLMTWCLGHVPEAKTVLDPWAGSGTTLVAAKLRGLKAVGIEINEEYCELAVSRLAQRILIAA